MERAGYWFRDASVPLPVQPEVPAQASLTEAEQDAAIYPDRAALIRATGGLPATLNFGPPEPDLVEALVNGTSPILRALDRQHEAATP